MVVTLLSRVVTSSDYINNTSNHYNTASEYAENQEIINAEVDLDEMNFNEGEYI